MDKEEFKQMLMKSLKESLRVRVNIEKVAGYDVRVKVAVEFCGEQIDMDSDFT